MLLFGRRLTPVSAWLRWCQLKRRRDHTTGCRWCCAFQTLPTRRRCSNALAILAPVVLRTRRPCWHCSCALQTPAVVVGVDTAFRRTQLGRDCAHVWARGGPAFRDHPCLHPAARPSWSKRLVILRACRVQHSVVDVREIATRCPGTLKEMVRLYLSALLAEDAATLEALSVAGLPMGQLATPPRSIPPTCLQAAMHAMARTGLSFISNAPKTCTDICARIDQYLTSEPRSRKKTVARPLPRTNLAAGSTAPLAYCQSWLGGRTSNPPLPPSLVCVVSNLLSSSFRASACPCAPRSRARPPHSKTGPRQYNMLCQAGHQMVRNLDREAALKAQAALVIAHSCSSRLKTVQTAWDTTIATAVPVDGSDSSDELGSSYFATGRVFVKCEPLTPRRRKSLV